MFSWSWNWVGGFDVADRREARNLNVNHDEQRSKTEDENDDEDDLGRKEASRKRHTVKNHLFTYSFMICYSI
jgi:hypothetical protein